tara:strand:- start:1816 stop:2424 length:609 start_codon:yes stop_codon:yes gene_type:complete
LWIFVADAVSPPWLIARTDVWRSFFASRVLRRFLHECNQPPRVSKSEAMPVVETVYTQHEVAVPELEDWRTACATARSLVSDVEKRAEAQQSYLKQLQRLYAQMQTKHNVFDVQEMSAVEATVHAAEDLLAELNEKVERKRGIFDRKMLLLEQAVEERLLIVEADDHNRSLLEADTHLMDIFAAKHAELLRHIKEARFEIAE